jgi:hypothetical protein
MMMWVEENFFFWKTQAERKNRINRQKTEGCRLETWREEKKLRELITIPKKCSKTINTYRVILKVVQIF